MPMRVVFSQRVSAEAILIGRVPISKIDALLLRIEFFAVKVSRGNLEICFESPCQ
jgi:hypothetical protein